MKSKLFNLTALAALFAISFGTAMAQVPTAPANSPTAHPIKRLELRETRYRLRAGELVMLDAPDETTDFFAKAKDRRVTITGPQGKGLVVGPGVNGRIVLAASLLATPGQYSVDVSATNEAGEERSATLQVVLDPMQPVPAGATRPPVILLNGWQAPFLNTGQFQLNTCASQPLSGTFGAGFDKFLTTSGGAQVVYWFDNCTECWNCKIEDLGVALGQVINLIQYTTGSAVPQVDLVAHSMGGLIIRAYLTGLGSDRSISPPPNHKVRKVIQIATPNFGAFLIDKVAADLLLGPFVSGQQSQELRHGSQFSWDLSTWNQGADDLRGVDALAIVGNLGTWKDPSGSTWTSQSDGVVSVTSASLAFARDASRTIILPYCHVDSSVLGNLPTAYQFCSGGQAGIAKAQETWNVVASFLADTPQWKSSSRGSVGLYGGVYVAAEDAAARVYAGDLSSIKFAGTKLTENPSWAFYYGDFLPAGSGTVAFSSPSLGTWQFARTVLSGTFAPLRLKLGPYIDSVGPLLSSIPKVVTSGGSVTLYGYGFGQQCSSCSVVAGSTQSLQVSSWSDQVITVSLPAYSGIVGLTVNAATGRDYVNIMAAPAVQPPAIALSKSTLAFNSSAGSPVPGLQQVEVTNSGGGGTLNWATISNAAWLTVSPTSGTAPSTLNIVATAANLTAGTYNGTITVSATGASPQTIAVSFVVAPALQLTANPSQIAFSYQSGASAPATQTVSVTTSAGSLPFTVSSSGAWLSVSANSGTIPAVVTLQANPAGLTPGNYTGQLVMIASGASNSPLNVPVSLFVTPAPSKPALATTPQLLSFTYQSGAATPPVQTLSITSSGASLPFTVSSSGGAWLSLSPTSASTPAALTVSVNPASLGAGTYSGQVAITATGASNSPIVIPVSLAVAAAQSTVKITGVANGASFSLSFASSTWVTISGANLSQTTRTWRGNEIVNGQLPTSLDGVSVKINGVPAYVYYISPYQLNVLAPTDNSTGTADQLVAVTVTAPDGIATTQALKRYVSPAMFMLDAQHVAAVNTDGSLTAVAGLFPGTQSHPAKPGDYVALYATGLGPTNPLVPAGQIPASPAALANSVTVSLGGASTAVVYAGLVSPGLYQINFQVPNVADGDQPIVIQVLGVNGQGNGVLTVRH